MSSIELDHVSKLYANGAYGVRDVDLSIGEGEFVIFLGPSGCGKSTTLRMIAGLEGISSGDLRIGGRSVNNVAPRDRNIAVVFQSYALYPHMSVRDNMGFGLKMRGVGRAVIDEKIREAAGLLGLTPYLDRKPAALSGGQRQRVALGRAIVRDPVAFLLDEPLSNLDAQLRAEMRLELVKLHRRLGRTIVHVTHDQVEAMTMATRIMVMDQGVVQQIDTPEGIYGNPGNTFVARFVGAPPMNLIPVRREGERLAVSGGLGWRHDGPAPESRALLLGLRPEALRVAAEGQGRIPVQVAVVERLGAETILGCRLAQGAQNGDARLLEHDLVFVRMPGNPRFRPEERCTLDYEAADAFWFDAASGARLRTAAPAPLPVRA